MKKAAPQRPKEKQEPRGEMLGRMAALGIGYAAGTVRDYSRFTYGPETHETGVNKGLETIHEGIKSGNIRFLECMLADQAISLNAIFNDLARKAVVNDSFKQLETCLRLALKAQNQSRATIDTLAQIKNPRHTVITKQANISTGPQQVNNTLNQITEPERKISENSETGQNKLLSHEEAERPYMDTRTEGQTSGDNPAMATVEKVNRADD